MSSVDIKNKNNFLRVAFSNRGLSRVFRTEKSLRDTTPNRQTILNVSNFLKDVKIKKEEPTGVRSLPELVGIDYIGYIIEKERLNKATGKWQKISEIKVIGSDANSFKDSRVAYGNLYRYRIKSVMKVTVEKQIESKEKFELKANLLKFQKDRLSNELRRKSTVLSELSRVARRGIPSKSSRGKKNVTDVELIKGFTVRGDEKGRTLVRVPVTDVYSKIKNSRSRGALRVSSFEFAKGNIERNILRKRINEKIERFSEKSVEYLSFYYESEPSRNWFYVDTTENVPPPPPHSIQIAPNSTQQNVCITWLKPANSQRDIKMFRLYRRNSVGEEWTLLKEFTDTENIYLDEDVKFQEKYIYAFTSVDAHDIESFLSMQIQTELNENIKAEKEERPLLWVSGSGASPDEVNAIFKKFVDLDVPIVVKRNVVISPRKDFAETSKKLLMRVKSLDTHETKEFVIDLKNVNIREDEYENA